MRRAVAIILAVTGCDQVYNLTRPPDARVDAAIDDATDAVDAPPRRCDFDDAGPVTSIPSKGTSIVAGLFDSGLSVDLAVGSTNLTQLRFYLNDKGAFPIATQLTLTEATLGLATGDMNNDGRDDLALVTATTASAMLQTASSWDRRMTDLIGGAPRTVTIANFDNAGLADMLVSIPSGQLVQIVLGGTTGYSRGQSITTIGAPTGAVARDIDGDSDLDVFVSIASLDGVGMFVDTGTTFATGRLLAAGTSPSAVDIVRLGNRPVQDIVVLGEDSDDVTILRNDGSANFAADPPHPVGDGPRAMLVFDLDGDDNADIITVNNKSNSVSLVRGTPTGFELATHVTTVAKPVALAAGDFSGDGRPDLAVLGEDDGFVIHTTVCAPF